MESQKTYSYEEVLQASMNYFGGDELAARVWVDKYAMKDSFGNIHECSPEDMQWRIAKEIARIEQKYANPLSADDIFTQLDHFRYIVPAGGSMAGIGNDYQVTSLSDGLAVGSDTDTDSCRLMAVNLYSCVDHPFTAEARFDFDLLSSHAALAQRFLDDIVDLELEKTALIMAAIEADPQTMEVLDTEYHLWQKLREKGIKERRTGLGVTVVDSTLAALGLDRATQQATDFLVSVQRALALAAYRSSVTLARERGAFANYSSDREREQAFIRRLREADGKLYEEMVHSGRRNIACLTTSNMGDADLLASSACGHAPQPVAASAEPKMVRDRRVAVLKWVDTPLCLSDGMPGLIAHRPEDVYSTVASCSAVGKERAVEHDGSHLQATAVQGKYPVVTEVRPQTLECDVVRFQNNKEKWVAFVGLLDGYPYEIFTGLQDDEEGIMLPKSVTKGKIIKQVNPDGTKRYDFQFENKRGYKTTVEGLSEKFNPEYWNYAKLISGVLRYRMPIDHVIRLVASLSLKDESINTWKVGVERALKKYNGDLSADEQESETIESQIQ